MAQGGIVARYKEPYRDFLYREMFARWGQMDVLARGSGTTVFSIDRVPRLLREIAQDPPVFLMHLHPFSHTWAVTAGPETQQTILQQVDSLAAGMRRSHCWTVQAHVLGERLPFDLTQAVAERLTQAGLWVDPTRADHALSLTVLEGRAFMGVSSLAENVSRWSGGVLFYQKPAEFISRAGFKLEEAVEVFGISLAQVTSALDLGAAPGGWTKFLADRGVPTDAVDPAALDPRVLANRRVAYFPVSAQTFAARSMSRQYDLIVNDMKMDACKSVGIVLRLLDRLRPDGQVVITLKLPQKGFLQKAQAARALAEPYFRTVRLKHLYYNRSEITLYAQRAG